jgi:8-oxo-dGTP pyrophosphatase MutT (NUDIX family)
VADSDLPPEQPPGDGIVAEMTWQTLGSRPVYTSPWVNLELVDIVLPDGTRLEHHVVRMPLPAAGVVVVDEAAGEVLMIWRHRFITDTWGWEIAAGRVEEGEDLAAGAGREVREETGWRVEALQPLVDYYPSNGISDQRFSIWLAVGATYEGAPSDVNEAARVAWLPITSLRSLIADRKITDGLTLTGLLAYLALRR